MGKPNSGMAEQVRLYVSKQEGPFACSVVRDELVRKGLKISTGQLQTIIWSMWRRGELKKMALGWYEYQPVMLNRRMSKERAKLLRAMSIKGRFSSREIAVLADVKGSTARHLAIELLRAGDLERIGKQRSARDGHEDVYRVRDRDGFFLKYVKDQKQ